MRSRVCDSQRARATASSEHLHVFFYTFLEIKWIAIVNIVGCAVDCLCPFVCEMQCACVCASVATKFHFCCFNFLSCLCLIASFMPKKKKDEPEEDGGEADTGPRSSVCTAEPHYLSWEYSLNIGMTFVILFWKPS